MADLGIGNERSAFFERIEALEAQLAQERMAHQMTAKLAVAAEARVAELTEALRLVRGPMPDAMHPRFTSMPKVVDWLVASQIVMDDALGEEDPGNVEASRAVLAAGAHHDLDSGVQVGRQAEKPE